MESCDHCTTPKDNDINMLIQSRCKFTAIASLLNNTNSLISTKLKLQLMLMRECSAVNQSQTDANGRNRGQMVRIDQE